MNIKGTLNQVTLIGRLGADPELKYTPAGVAVVSLSIATTTGWKGSAGEWVEDTEWHKVIAWRGIADYAEKYGFKGARVYVVGTIKTRYWTDKNTTKHSVTEIQAAELSILEDVNAKERASYTKPAPVQQSASTPQPAGAKTNAQPELPGTNTTRPREFTEPNPNDSDDLPF
jgi:single-strand DNA-binding protein